ncbi:MAG: hydroxyacid dehydrogenase, partial [Chitinophagales bacterium]
MNLNWDNKKILITEVVHPVVETQLSELGFECTHLEKTTYKEVLAQINQYAGLIVRSKIKVDKAMIDQGQALRFIGRTGSGMEHINQAYAESKGIAVFRSPEGNKDSVAEQAVGMLLCLLNNIVKSDGELRQRYWNRLANRGEELMGK